MKKVHLFGLMIGLLLLLNTGTLAFLFMTRHGGPHGGPPHGPPDRMITEKLRLDAQQQAQYRQMREAHQDTMRTLQDAYQDALQAYFGLLGTPYTADQKSAGEDRLTAIQRQRVDVTFRHFEGLKAICTPEQQSRFADIMPDIADVMIGGRPRRSSRPDVAGSGSAVSDVGETVLDHYRSVHGGLGFVPLF